MCPEMCPQLGKNVPFGTQRTGRFSALQSQLERQDADHNPRVGGSSPSSGIAAIYLAAEIGAEQDVLGEANEVPALAHGTLEPWCCDRDETVVSGILEVDQLPQLSGGTLPAWHYPRQPRFHTRAMRRSRLKRVRRRPSSYAPERTVVEPARLHTPRFADAF